MKRVDENIALTHGPQAMKHVAETKNISGPNGVKFAKARAEELMTFLVHVRAVMKAGHVQVQRLPGIKQMICMHAHLLSYNFLLLPA